MKNNKNISCKTVLEISSLSSLLTPSNQSYVLNTIHALLFSQQVNEEQQRKGEKIWNLSHCRMITAQMTAMII